MSDWELIQNYCRNGSESAFEALVKRHLDFVYCAALRQVRDPSLAEDITQAVFLMLVRKVRNFRSGTILVSWLFRTTHYIAARALRSEHRRQRRELEAASMNPQTTTSETDRDWEQVAPVLDEALATLPAKDRDAVLFRFISHRPFSQVGAEIGVSEEAAKKRVSRALARLREFFMRRGTTLSVAGIALMLGERAVQASPAVLATKITAALGAGASAAASTAAGALLKAALHDLFWAKLRWAAAIGAAVIGAFLLLSIAAPPGRSDVTIPAYNERAAQSEPSVASKRAAARKSDSNEMASDRTLNLLVMRAEDRQPVEGARVLVEACTAKQRERTLDALTDRYGVLRIPIPQQSFIVLMVWVSAKGHVPMVMSWQGHEFNEPVISHTLFLEPGQAAAGIVLDELGIPVPDAKVSFSGPGMDLGKRENRHFHPELSASFTDAEGRWATTQLPQGACVNIRVTHPDFTPASPCVGGLPGFPTNALLVLSNGVALGGRVTAADGTPIRTAEIAKQSGVYLRIRTDADGRFFWPHIEPGQVFVDVEAEGFETIHEFAWATNATNECEFTLKKSPNPVQSTASFDQPRIRLRGTVVDADTGEPIPQFKVLLGAADYMGPGSADDTVLHGARLLGEGHDGQFDWGGLPRGGGFRLQIEADDYMESVSEERSHREADQDFNFRLRRGVTLAGRVVTPDGSAAENAVVSLAGPGIGPVMQSPGRLIEPNPGFEETRTQTDSEGIFRLKLKTGARGVAVVHQSGSALLTFEAATNHAVVLQPWGAIDGALFLNKQPAPNQRVSVTGCQKSDADPRLLFSFSYRTTTDDRGHFRFNQVLPGEHSVAREVGFLGGGPARVNGDHAAVVKVESGAVASVELSRQGRPVIGRIVFKGSPDEVHWGMSAASLQGERGFPFALSRDGTMRADDVAPGTYTLSIQLESGTVEPVLFPRPQFGSLQKQVIVPSAEDESVPVDLGELTIQPAK